MKMVMVILDEAKREELEVFLESLGVAGYTEVSQVRGSGSTGRRLGSSAFPRTSALVFSVMDEAMLERLRAGAAKMCEACGVEPRIFAWEVEELANG